MVTKDKEYVLKMVKENDVKFIRLWFTDILGFLKSFAITVEELEGAFSEGMGFDGSSIQGFARIDESDLSLNISISGTAREQKSWTAVVILT
jgi:glutamine synthetase